MSKQQLIRAMVNEPDKPTTREEFYSSTLALTQDFDRMLAKRDKKIKKLSKRVAKLEDERKIDAVKSKKSKYISPVSPGNRVRVTVDNEAEEITLSRESDDSDEPGTYYVDLDLLVSALDYAEGLLEKHAIYTKYAVALGRLKTNLRANKQLLIKDKPVV